MADTATQNSPLADYRKLGETQNRAYVSAEKVLPVDVYTKSFDRIV